MMLGTRTRARRDRRGFTLLELSVVAVILALLAAIVAPAVTGVAGTARQATKQGDMKDVDTGVGRYEADNPGTYPLRTGYSTPTQAIVDTDGDGVIKVKVDTSASDPSDWTGVTFDVTCGGPSVTSMANALKDCFGAIDFTKLVPNYVKNTPQYDDKNVVVTFGASNGADLTITRANMNGDTLELYLDANITAGDGLYVWNVDKNNNPVVLVKEEDYGKAVSDISYIQ